MQFGGRRASTATEKDIGREEKTKTVGMVVFVIHTRGTEISVTVFAIRNFYVYCIDRSAFSR